MSSLKKKCQVVVLSTENNKQGMFCKSLMNILLKESSHPENNQYQNQHLYILSDEEIEAGDWCLEYNTLGNKVMDICKAPSIIPGECILKKIIATTDSSLKDWDKVERENLDARLPTIPQPSPQFITKYIEEYNKGNVITEVMVEYEKATEYDRVYNKEKYFPRLLVDKNNCITITKVKDSYSRKEVVTLLRKYHRSQNESINTDIVDNWIEQNL